MSTEEQRNPSAIRGKENNREAVWAILIAAGDAEINAADATKRLGIAVQTCRNYAHELGAWCLGGSKNARWYLIRPAQAKVPQLTL